MKTSSILISSALGLVLSTTANQLRAEPAEAGRPPASREEIRRLLKELPPEERRALIMELRDRQARQTDLPRPDASRPFVNRAEISRQLRDLPPEERRARIGELRGQRPVSPDLTGPEERRAAPRERQPGERPAFRGLPGAAAGRFAPIFERVLNEDQRSSFREAMEAKRGELRELEERLRLARREALQASVGREFNEDLVREKAMAVARAEAEMAVLRARALSQIKPSLSADQIEKLSHPPLLDGNVPRQNLQRDEPRRGERPARGPRDENDLPPRPRPER